CLQQSLKRPIVITLIAWLFILVGAGTLLRSLFFALLADSSHIRDPLGRFRWDDLLAVAVALASLLGGVLLLKRSEWGRWLILAWLLFHVVIVVDRPIMVLATHFALMLVVGYFLMRPQATAYFSKSTRSRKGGKRGTSRG
ncbi:MAG TPA: hypothetical protein VKG92_09645, partial [Flavobacteriales bacterium]|nr:hypothetical protein [Flavobacteriales bacterium]